ncbi:hypothetical protein ACSSS7_002562 [Eimeria intestinalis]
MQTYMLDHVVGMRTPLDETAVRNPDPSNYNRSVTSSSNIAGRHKEGGGNSPMSPGTKEPRQHHGRSLREQEDSATGANQGVSLGKAEGQMHSGHRNASTGGCAQSSTKVPLCNDPIHSAGYYSTSVVSECSYDCPANRSLDMQIQCCSSSDALGGVTPSANEIYNLHECGSNTEFVTGGKDPTPPERHSSFNNEHVPRWLGTERMQRITNAVAAVFNPVQLGSVNRRRRRSSQSKQGHKCGRSGAPWRRTGSVFGGRPGGFDDSFSKHSTPMENEPKRLRLSARLTRAFGWNDRIHMVRLRFCSREMEDSYKHNFYSNKAHINTIQQAIIIFLVAFIYESIVFLTMDRLSPATCEVFQSHRMLVWSVRSAIAVAVLLLWLLLHYRQRASISSLRFDVYPSLTAQRSPSSILPSPVDQRASSPRDDLHEEPAQVAADAKAASLSSAMLVSQPTSERLRGILIVTLLLIVNLLSCYVREHDDRQTYIVNQEASALERRSLELLNDMLPKELLVEFQNDNLRLAYSHESLGFLFADICGFTAWSKTVSAEQVLSLLQRLFTRFDRDTIELDLYKLCTIGDAYVAVSGLRIDSPAYETLSGHHEGFSSRHGAPGAAGQTDPLTGSQWRSQWENLNGVDTGGWREHRETDEAGRILSMARQMLEHVQAVREEMQIPGLDMRIGLHVGSCVGGVIGSRRLRYDLWGLDVLVGNDIESNGVPGQICCSQEFKTAFQKEKHNEPRCCE